MSTRNDILAQMYEDIQASTIFASGFRDFSEMPVNPTDLDKYAMPLLSAIDTGAEQADVTDDSGTRFSVIVMLSAIVRSTSEENLGQEINDALSAIKNLIASNPLTHAGVRAWQYVSSDSIDIEGESTGCYAVFGVETRLIYYAASGSF